MAKILVVDDRPINREFLATLLGYLDHEILQAADGAEALALATAERPDLIITDVLMPVMDGVEFVRLLRTDPTLAGVPVIFYTATYRLNDARQMAESCGVDTVIGKPASPQLILEAVVAKLGGPAEALRAQSPAPPGLLGGRLSAWMGNLPQLQRRVKESQTAARKPLETALQRDLIATTNLSLRLAALLELGQELAAERDLDRLFESFIRAAQHLMNARYAAAGRVEPTGGATQVSLCGLPEAVRPLLAAEGIGGVLGRVQAGGKAQRLGKAIAPHCLPRGHPPVHAVLALPLHLPTRSYGWLYFADPLDAEAFSDEDEQIALALATMLAQACENLLLYGEVSSYAGELEIEVAARRESEERFRELAENIREAFWLIDPAATKVFYVSPAYAEIWGRSGASFCQNPDSWREGIHPDDRAAVQAGLSQLSDSGKLDMQFRLLRPDGSQRWVRSRGFPIRNEQGELLRVAGLTEDITVRKQQEDSITRLTRTLAVLSGINAAIMRIREPQALFEEACRIAVDDGRFSVAWIGRKDGGMLLPLAWRRRDGQATAPQPLHLAEVERPTPGNSQVVVCDEPRSCAADDPNFANAGSASATRSRAILSLLEGGAVVGALVLYADEPGFFDAGEVRLLDELAGDVSFALDFIASEQRANYLAYYDALTGLPNRSLFVDRVDQMLHRAAHDGSAVALILLGLDHFQRINDSLGRHVGDALLKRVAVHLTEVVREPHSLARLGGGVFVVALSALPADDDAMSVLRETILPALETPWTAAGGAVPLTARAGFALYPGDGDTAETLLSHGEAALRQANASGTRYCYYDGVANARIVAKLALEAELGEAISKDQFVVHYQPKISLQSGEIVGAEALLRWLHPQRGLVDPAEFIPLAEDSGQIVAIGEWVLRNVCAQQARWLAGQLDVVPVAVNLSAVQFHSRDVVAMVREALEAAHLDPRYLELEVTESVVLQNPERQVVTLKALRTLGVGLSLDDFGTGYSSLAYLKRFPFSDVKIDRAFIRDVTHNAEDAAIVDAVIAIAARLGMKTIAEGVETVEQMQFLRRRGCDEIQGSYFSQPVAQAEFEAMLRTGRGLALSRVGPDMRTLLLVDDEPDIFSTLRGALRRDGYTILTAGSGREALDLLAIHEVQVIVSEQRMPAMSGAAFLSVVKELYPDTIRIILTAYTDLDSVIDAVNQGAVFRFLTKPWEDELLREHIHDAFRWYRPAREDKFRQHG